jgi:hypothetical protein
MFGMGCAQSTVQWDTLGAVVMGATRQDGDMLIFNGRDNPEFTFKNIPTFVVGDEKLERFLDVAADKAVILEMYKNRSDFHVYDFNTETRVPWARKIPKEFNQPEGMHEKLGLEYAADIHNHKLQFTLVFDDTDKAIPLANNMRQMAEKYPDVLFKCWDIVESDIGHHEFEYPSIVVSSLAHSGNIYDMKRPVTPQTLGMFIRANILKLKDYTLQKEKKKGVLPKEKTVYMTDL